MTGNATDEVTLRHVGVQHMGGEDDTAPLPPPALQDIDLTVRRGEIVLLCGRSGSGKSTLLRTLNGLTTHFDHGRVSGEVRVGGVDPTTAPLHETGRAVATVFQNPRTQFFSTEVYTELAFASENAGEDPAAIRARIADVAESVGLVGLLPRGMAALSGGEKQRVACGAALVARPRVHLFDEPTSNLDQAAIGEVARVLRRLREAGGTALIAEHRLWFLDGLVDRVVHLDGGRVAGEWTAAEFWALDEARRSSLGLRSLTPPTPDALAERFPTRSGTDGLVATDVRCRHTRRGPWASAIDHLHLPRGVVTAIVGPNGAGKTTLARALAGLDKPRKGTISLDGRVLRGRERLAVTSVVMQDVAHQLFAPSVREEVALGAAPGTDVDALLTELGLAELADRHPLSLSGGQMQRTTIGAAMAADTQVYLFDEPTSGLDGAGAATVAHVLRSLADAGAVVAVITHDTDLAAQCADQVVELRRPR